MPKFPLIDQIERRQGFGVGNLVSAQIPRRRLINVQNAAFLLDCSHRLIYKMIQSGRIEFAFNVASPSAKRPAIRIFSHCVFAAVQGAKHGITKLEDAMECIAPSKQITLRQAQIAWLMSCDSEHVHNLVLANCMAEVGAVSREKESPKITRASFVRFLAQRRFA